MNQECVTDTSVWINLHKGRVLDRALSMPDFTFSCPDLVLEELTDPLGSTLPPKGVQMLQLTGEQLEEVIALRSAHPRPSAKDLSSLLLARNRHATLLTDDGALRDAAEKEGLEPHGTLWLLDRMVEAKIIPPLNATLALKRTIRSNARFPPDEVAKRLKSWQSRSD